MNAPVKPSERVKLETLVFEAGERVPDWLVQYEQVSQFEGTPVFFFDQRTAVVDAGDVGFFAINVDSGFRLDRSVALRFIGVDQRSSFRFSAPDRGVMFMQQGWSIGPDHPPLSPSGD